MVCELRSPALIIVRFYIKPSIPLNPLMQVDTPLLRGPSAQQLPGR